MAKYYPLKIGIFCIGVLLSSFGVNAQVNGHEWIDYNRSYVKIQVLKKGMYRLDFNVLNTALSQIGLSASTVPRRSYQIHRRGKEQAIFVSGAINSFQPLNASEYLEFYGVPNDALDDSLMYYDPADMYNPYYAMHSDTASYFLSVHPDPQAQGKRMTVLPPDPSFSLPVEPYVWQSKRVVFSGFYGLGPQYPFNVNLSPQRDNKPILTLVDKAEGHLRGQILFGGPTSGQPDLGLFTFDSLFPLYTAQSATVKPRLKITVVGQAQLPVYSYEIRVGPSVSNLRQIYTGIFNYYNFQSLDLPLELSDVSAAGQLVVRVVNITPTSSVCLSWAELRYPVLPQGAAAQREFHIAPSTAAPFKAHFRTTNFPTPHTLYQLDYKDSLLIHPTQVVAGTLAAIIPQNQNGNTLWLRDNNQFEVPTSFKAVRFRNFATQAPQFLIISHPLLRQAVQGVPDPVAAYAAYRKSLAGGGYDTAVAMISEVYDAYGYGDYNQVAIKRMIRHMQALGQLKFVFIIGKGITTYGIRQSPAAMVANLIPTMGFPGGDNAFVMGLRSSMDSVEIPIGRINAKTSTDVLNYLNKVIQQESQVPAQEWRKNVLHLVGGSNQSEITLFSAWMNAYAQTASGPLLGARVRTRSKETTANVEFINIADQINTGQLLVNIFAHSNPNFIDIDIGDVNSPVNGYNNNGRYPFFLISGCKSGSIYGNTPSWGEPWVLSPNKGALHFFAHADNGFTLTSDRFTRVFYDSAFRSPELYGAPVGKVIEQTHRRMMQFVDPSTKEFGSYAYYKAHVEQTVLQGDPAVKLIPADKPDLAINSASLSLSTDGGQTITAAVDSLTLSVPVTNFGRALTDSFDIEIRRQVSGAFVGAPLRIRAPRLLRTDTLEIRLANAALNPGGLNRIEVELDPDQLIDEITRTNNSAILELNLPLGGAKALWPSEFSIVGNATVRLVAEASTTQSGQELRFQIEFDTTYEFNSLMRRDTLIRQERLAEWNVTLSPSLQGIDSLVVYWRVRLQNPPTGVDGSFSNSSFTYISGSQGGWSQRGFDQYRKNSLSDLSRDFVNKTLDFVSVSNAIRLRSSGDSVQSFLDSTLVSINGEVFVPSFTVPGGPCVPNSMLFIAFNKNTGAPYSILSGFPSGTVLCGKPPGLALQVNIANANATPSSLIRLQNSLQVGDPVVMVSNGRVDYPALNAQARAVLEDFGVSAAQFSLWQSGFPIIFQGFKGATPGSASIFFPDTNANPGPNFQLLEQTVGILGRQSKGTMRSTLIGPALQWNLLLQGWTSQHVGDTARVQLFGIDSLGQEQLIFEADSGRKNLSSISAQQYPRLRLKVEVEDTALLTAPQLRNWMVTYEEIPEATALRQGEAELTVPEGRELSFSARFRNVSPTAFSDTLLPVRVTWSNADQGSSEVFWDTIPAPLPGTERTWQQSYTTRGKSGNNTLQIFFNPFVLPESDYGNNVLSYRVNVQPDNKHPLLEVSIDGRRLMNGDLVSPTPEIHLLMRDDNPYLALGDTAGIEVLHKRPCSGCDFQRVGYLDGLLEANVSDPSGKRFEVNYRPEKLEDGIHTLAVQAKDASGNKAADKPYTISFEVVNASSITHFYPYPNPFSTACRFVFTLTGAEVPDQLMIRILTVSGRIVREIGLQEFGPIQIGNNQSSFVWDGTDQFGDRLANGVYLYKVTARVRGQAIPLRESAGDGGFKNDYGKLYILR